MQMEINLIRSTRKIIRSTRYQGTHGVPNDLGNVGLSVWLLLGVVVSTGPPGSGRAGGSLPIWNRRSCEQGLDCCLIGHCRRDGAEPGVALIAQKPECIEEEDPAADINIHGGD